MQVTAAGGCRQVVETSCMRDAMTTEPDYHGCHLFLEFAHRSDASTCGFIHVKDSVKELSTWII